VSKVDHFSGSNVTPAKHRLLALAADDALDPNRVPVLPEIAQFRAKRKLKRRFSQHFG
jgi:hypothetical protein